MMKLFQFILLVWISTVIETKNLDKKLLFEGCDHDGWKVHNISIARTADKINFTASILSSDEKTSNTSHQVKFILTGCSDNYTCTNFTNLITDNLNCTSTNHTEFEQEECTAIKIIENWVRESTNLRPTRENKNPRDGCILYEKNNTLKPQTTPKPQTTSPKSEQKNGIIHKLLSTPIFKHDLINSSTTQN